MNRLIAGLVILLMCLIASACSTSVSNDYYTVVLRSAEMGPIPEVNAEGVIVVTEMKLNRGVEWLRPNEDSIRKYPLMVVDGGRRIEPFRCVDELDLEKETAYLRSYFLEQRREFDLDFEGFPLMHVKLPSQ